MDATEPVAGLVVEGVTKHGIKSVSFAAMPGQLVTITGPCKGGKSTVAGMVAGFVKPDSGRVLLDGDDIHSLDETELARRVGWMCATVLAPGSGRRPAPQLVVADEPQWRIGVGRVRQAARALTAQGSIVVVTQFIPDAGGFIPSQVAAAVASKFGSTPEDRARLRVQFAVADREEAKAAKCGPATDFDGLQAVD